MPNLIKRSEEVMMIDDLDHGKQVELKKTHEVWEGDNGEIFERSTVCGLQTGEGLITSAKDVGPVCSRWWCGARLSAQNLRICSVCERPLCRHHSKKLRGKTLCIPCFRKAKRDALVAWLFSPMGSGD